MTIRFSALLLIMTFCALPGQASVMTFGDKDCLGTGCYGASDPTAGATLQGLAPGVITLATNSFGHNFPFSPNVADLAGTDQIFVGSPQTASHDGYSVSTPRDPGPQTLVLDYSSLVGAGQSLSTLTLGIAADDFQFPAFGQPFTASLNGSVNAALTAQLNALNQTGPRVQFLTIGLSPALDTGTHVLTLSINEGGDGGDGWAVDFLTVGATTTGTSETPEPSSTSLIAFLLAGVAILSIRRRFKAA